MAITLNLNSETEARLIAQAAEKGVSVEQFLQAWIEKNLPTEIEPEEDWRTVLQEFCNYSALANVPPISDDAVSRTYLEREDSQL